MGALDDVRVLDLTSVLLGPYATLMLADLGADVLKVEPLTGDIMRKVGPHRSPGMGPVFLAANRNKRSIALDLRSPRGRDAFARLVQTVDVLVHNVRPRSAEKLGIDHPTLARLNPGLVHCSAHGFGEDGPLAGRPAYDDAIQAISGVAALQEPFAGEPQYSGSVVADKTVGLAVAVAALAGLHHRDRTGEGQAIEVPMFETMASWVLLEHLYGETFVPAMGETGYPRATSPKRRPYRTRDGWIGIVLYTDAHWRAFFSLVDRDDLADDPRVTDITLRTTHIDELYGIVEGLLGTRTTDAWLADLESADIPAAPVNRPGDLLTDPHLTAVGLFEEVDHPTEGRVRQVMMPTRLSRTPVSNRRPAPLLGQHTREVLLGAGLSTDEVDAMVAEGAALEPPA